MSLRRKIPVIAGIVLGIVILVPVVRHYQLRWELHSLIAQLKAKGVPVDLAQIVPPSLPPERNGADALIQANDAFNKSVRTGNKFFNPSLVYGMMAVAPGKAMIVSQQPEFKNSEGTLSWEQIANGLDANAKSIEPLQQLIDKPDLDFHFDYSKGFDGFALTNFYLAESKRAVQRLETAAFYELHQGDTAGAVTNVRAMLALTKAMDDERLLISELVSYAMAQITLTVNWELLQSPNVTDEQLAQLQNDWTQLDFIHGEANAIAMECAMDQVTAEQWRSSNAKFMRYVTEAMDANGLKRHETTFEKIRTDINAMRWRYWWSYPDEMEMLKGFTIIRETSSFLETNYSFQTAMTAQNKKMNKLFGVQTNDHFNLNMHSLFSQSVPSFGVAIRKTESSEAAKQIIIAAIALKRYQLKHGNYPANLDALVPEFIVSVPLDPVDGQPLRYRLNGDGSFVLYSLGDNGIDDGGSTASTDPKIKLVNYYWENARALDWVWPQPAAQDEIQKFYEKLSKSSRR